MKVLLASSSPSRRQLLKQAGVAHDTFDPNIPEADFLKTTQLAPKDICLELARQKGEKGEKHSPESAVIACDQLAFLNGSVFAKAHTTEKAIEHLSRLQGQRHELIHGLYMSFRGQILCQAFINKMSMRPLSQNQIKHYVLKDKPLKSAGSYLVDSLGLGLFQKIESEDFSSIIGLPVTAVLNQLIKWGFRFL